jgi:hypothetical protein
MDKAIFDVYAPKGEKNPRDDTWHISLQDACIRQGAQIFTKRLHATRHGACTNMFTHVCNLSGTGIYIHGLVHKSFETDIMSTPACLCAKCCNSTYTRLHTYVHTNIKLRVLRGATSTPTFLHENSAVFM